MLMLGSNVMVLEIVVPIRGVVGHGLLLEGIKAHLIEMEDSL
jgi:hypothetical protein